MMLNNNQLLLAKVEASYGVDPTPTGPANAILAAPVDTRLDVAKINLSAVRRSISAQKITLGRKMVEFTVTVDLKGSGAAGTPPEFGALMRACSMAETINAGVSVVYKPENDAASMKSITIYFYYDGRLRKALGCMGNFTLSAPPGGVPQLVFNLRGKLSSDADAALPNDQVYQSTEPVIIESGGVSFGAFNDAVIRNISYVTGNSLIDRMDVNSAEGVKGVFVSGRDPRLSTSIEAELEATKAFFANYESRVEEAVDVTIGTVAGNIVTLAIPKFCVDEGLDPQNENGIILFGLSGQALESSAGAEDNITITFS